MSNSLYITSLEGQSGKTAVALAFMEQLTGRLQRVSVFRPVLSQDAGSDRIIALMANLYHLQFSPDEMYGISTADARPFSTPGNTRSCIAAFSLGTKLWNPRIPSWKSRPCGRLPMPSVRKC